MEEIMIRTALVSDAETISKLSDQLGYAATKESTEKYLQLLQPLEQDVVYVAVSDKEVIGWMHVFKTVRIESGIFCEIGGLVVDEKFRGKGIGKMLVEKAKEWATEKGSNKLRVRSNIQREATKNFYLHSGFRLGKVQNVFECIL